MSYSHAQECYLTPFGNYSRVEFDDEADFEKAVVSLTKALLGPGVSIWT